MGVTLRIMPVPKALWTTASPFWKEGRLAGAFVSGRPSPPRGADWDLRGEPAPPGTRGAP